MQGTLTTPSERALTSAERAALYNCGQGVTHTFAATCTPPPGQTWTTYYYAGSQRIAQRVITSTTTAGTLYYLHGDHLGSTSLVTCGSGCGTAGAVVARQRYHPFGTVRGTPETMPTDYAFTGQIADDTGLMFYNARYYDPYLYLNSPTRLPSTLDKPPPEVHHGPVYTDFFELAELPFRITPDPRFLWYSPQHREVKAIILHHLQTRKGPVYLFADVGTGKTSIAKRIHDELREDQSKQVVNAFAPNLKTSNAFLCFVMEEFGVKTDRSYAVSLKNFEQFLLDQYQAGISPVLLVDEAQNVTFDMLKLIHHLFNFSTNTEFLIQVALFPSSICIPPAKNSLLRLEHFFYTISSSFPGRSPFPWRSAVLSAACRRFYYYCLLSTALRLPPDPPE